jgi:iron complex outermembrane recepter protein
MNLNVARFVSFAVAFGTTPFAHTQNQSPAADDTTLEEVVVTAQKREESLRDVPLSVSAVSGFKLADAGIVRLDDLKAYVPNLQMTETGIANNIYIRGIGSGLNQGFEQSVSTYADGIYRGRGHQSRMPFLDLARVEVLRGPQPVLFGKNAVAGAVNLVGALPTKEFEGSVRTSYDFENNDWINTAVLSGPISDTAGMRLAIHQRSADGYIKNATLDRSEPKRDELGARFTVKKDFTENLSTVLRVEGGHYNTDGRQIEIFGETPIAAVPNRGLNGLTYSQIVGGPVPAFPRGQNATARNNSIDFIRSSNGDSSDLSNFEAGFTANYRFGDDATVTSVTGYSKYALDEQCDCDFVGATVFRAGIQEHYAQFSEEVRVASSTKNTVSWIAGVFFQNSQLDESDYLFVPATSLVPVVLTSALARPPGPGVLCTSAPTCAPFAGLFANAANPRVFTQDSRLWSVFAQATWKATDSLKVAFGARLNSEKKDGSRVTQLTAGLGGPNLLTTAPAPLRPAIVPLFAGVLGIIPHSESDSLSETDFSPMVNLQYSFATHSMAYVSWAKGSKAGGFDARSNKPVSSGGTFQFKPEKATTYEVGLKSAVGGSAEINADIFYTDYKDLQTSAFDGRIGFNVGNGSAKVKGVEIDSRWRVTPQFMLTGSAAYLDFEWTKYCGQPYFDIRLAPPSGTCPAGNADYKGFTNQLAPKFSGVVSAEYDWHIGSLKLATTADVVYSAKYLQSLTLDPANTQAAYTKVNARVSLGNDDRSWELALVGKNLTDKTTVSYAGDTPLAAALFNARSYYGFVDVPRSIALEGSFRF